MSSGKAPVGAAVSGRSGDDIDPLDICCIEDMIILARRLAKEIGTIRMMTRGSLCVVAAQGLAVWFLWAKV